MLRSLGLFFMLLTLSCQFQAPLLSDDVIWVKVSVVDSSPLARHISDIYLTMIDPKGNGIGGYGFEKIGVGPDVYNVTVCLRHALYGIPGDRIRASKIVTLPPSLLGSEVTIDFALPIYDVTVGLLTPFGDPIKGAQMSVGGVWVGVTDEDGNVAVQGMPNGTFPLSATLYGLDISPSSSLTVRGNDIYQFTATRMGNLRIKVATQIGLGIPESGVTIRTNLTVAFSGKTDSQGEVTCCLPFGSFEARVLCRGYELSETFAFSRDMTETIVAPFCVEIFGILLDGVGTAILAVAVLLVIAVLIHFLRTRSAISSMRYAGTNRMPAPSAGGEGTEQALGANVILCPHCGRENRTTDRFCRECGRPPTSTRALPARTQPIAPTKPFLPSQFGIVAVALFLLGALTAMVVHESIHVILVEHFGGIVWSIRILGVVVYPTLNLADFSWTGDIADVEGYFPVLPPSSDLWLAHWMPEVVGLLSVLLILIVFVRRSVSDNPGLFAFLFGMFATNLFGLIAVAMSLI